VSARKLFAATAVVAITTTILALRASAAGPRIITRGEVRLRTRGIGSIPGALLRDGTVCITPTEDSLECRQLAKLSRETVDELKWPSTFFDGIYDLDNSGDPEIFFDYWPVNNEPNCPAQYRAKDDPWGQCNAIALLVYKKIGGSYRQYAVLNARTMGYSPGAWFLTESPLRKAIFFTRCGGSSGGCLFYLNWKERKLEPISNDLYMIEPPAFEDVDGDGFSEIFVTARGYDRTAENGAALLRWKDGTYRVWWPTSGPPPYVISARVVDVDQSRQKEIVAVLDPEAGYPRESTRRELGIWRLVSGNWSLVAMNEIPGVQDADWMIAYPELFSVTPNADGADIALTCHGGSLITCRYAKRKIRCPPCPREAK
jgi:hypothetical protein